MPQDLPSGREVMRISATDIDDGNNSIVHYSLDSNSPDQAYFFIDPDNGVIFLNKTIDVSVISNFNRSFNHIQLFTMVIIISVLTNSIRFLRNCLVTSSN